MNKKNIKISIIMVNYNGKEYFPECFQSLSLQTYDNYEIIVVDNCSTDGSVNALKRDYSYVNVIESSKNLGFGAGNNLGVAHSKGELIVFTNYDVVFDRFWLENLVSTAMLDSRIGLVSPKIMLYDDKDLVNTCGLAFQYTGHAFTRGCGRHSDDFSNREQLASVTGCAFLIKREVLDKVGTFDEEFQNFGRFFHSSLEDIDLGWRAQLAGYKIISEPSALMYHKYVQKPLTPIRYYYLECGRYYMLLKNYKAFTIVLLFPAFFLSELVSWVFVSLKGGEFIREKILSYKWLMSRLSYIKKMKKSIIHEVSDYEILREFQTKTEVRHFNSGFLFKISEFMLNGLYYILKVIPLGVLVLIK